MEERPTRLDRIRAMHRGGVDSGGDSPAHARTRVPEMPLAIVEWIEGMYPDRCPSKETSREEFIAHAAQVEVARACRTLYERQEAERLKDAGR